MPRSARSVDFFKVWSPEMAYVLGYWWADGCMRIKKHGAHEIEIASNDHEHLKVITQVIGENYYLRKVTAQSNTFVISFCSKQMYYDLLALGGTPHKSRTIGFPELPDNLIVHFVRGVIDGDGTLAWNGDRPVIHIYSGSPQFITSLTLAVEKITGIPAPNTCANRNNWYIKWSTIRAKCLAAWLYKQNPGLALGRKAAIAADFIQWQPKKRPSVGTITETMKLHFSAYLPI